MRRTIAVFILALALAATAAVSGPTLERKLPTLAEGELLWINITLSEQLDPAVFQRIQADLPREAAREAVVDLMKSFARQEQAGLLDELAAWESTGRVADLRPFWITNFIACRADATVITELLEHPEVARVETGSDRPDEFVGTGSRSGNPAWSVTKVGAPFVWDNYGYYGDGYVVAVSDTGVNYEHYDLRDHLWTNSDEIPDNGIDDDFNGYVDDYYGYYFDGTGSGGCDPMDTDGHGTHCAGSVSSDGAAGIDCGVAPQADIMSLRTYMYATHQGEMAVWESWQYALDNGADISSNSIGWNYGWSPDRSTWRANAEAAMAAGMTMVIAAGNDGPADETVTCPGDVPGVITVGATKITDEIAGFSGRGPVDWSSIAPYYDYPSLTKPDVCAPGVDIVSCDFQNIQGYLWGWNGTSMATPHTAGTAALLLDANPTLTPAQIRQALEDYAKELGDPGKDNVYGSGRINSFASVSDYVGSPVLELTFDGYDIDDSAGDGDGLVEPGETITVYCDVYNPSLVTATSLDATLTSTSGEVTIVDGSDSLGNLAPLEAGSAEFTVSVDGGCPEPQGLPLTVSFDAANPYTLEEDLELFVPGYGLAEDCEFGIDRLWRYEANGDNTWAVNDEQALYGQYSFSPNNAGGGYDANLDCSLVSLPFHIDTQHNIMTVWAYFELEGGRDMCQVQIQYAGEDTWTTLHTISGAPDPQWMRRTSDLSSHEGETARLRLLFRSDSDDVYQGVWLDEIYVVDYEVDIDDATLSAVSGENGVLLSWDVSGDFAALEIFRVEDESALSPGAPLNELPLTNASGAFLDRDYAPAYLFEITDSTGRVTRLGPVETAGAPASTGRTLLAEPYPNPTAGALNVSFELSADDAAEDVLVALYDLAGRRVRTISAGSLTAGRHELTCSLDDVGSGVYLLRLQTASGSLLRRVALVR